MSVYPCVVVGSDGSPTATHAVGKAAALAAGLSAPLVVVTAFARTRPEDLGPPSARAQMPGEGWAAAAYQAACATASDAAAIAARVAPPLQVDTSTPEGEPAAALLDTAGARPGSLLVVGNRGMSTSARFVLGSVPNRVTHHAVGDVLVVHSGHDGGSAAPARLLIGTDGSKTARRAVDRGIAIAAALGAQVTLLTAQHDHVRARRLLDEAGQVAESAGVDWTADPRTGAPVDALLDAARAHDLLVVGNKGMTGAGRFLLGSVPNKVSHHATTDLLIVKTDA